MSFVPGAVGGSSVPILKANAKSGRFVFDDESVTEIQLIVDLENAEAGWMRFGENMSPDFRMVRVRDLLTGKQPYPAPPDVRDREGKLLYRRGFRLMVKLTPKCAAGRPAVRELATNSLVMTSAIDDLLRAWEEQRVPDKLPRVGVTRWNEIKGPHGSNYSPRFEIRGLVDHPDDLRPVNGLDGPDAPEDFDDED